MKPYLATLIVAVFPLLGICYSTIEVNPTMLFSDQISDQKPIELILQMDMQKVLEDKSDDPEYSHATLIHQIDKEKIQLFNIKIKARGRTRRIANICDFPPIKLNFEKKSTANTIFEGQDKIKMFTHCNETEQYQNFAMLEYLAYKTYNILTNCSYRVRMVHVTYRDTERNYADIRRLGFLMEDEDLLAARLHGEITGRRIWSSDSCVQKSVDILALFEFMIGNTDWWIPTRHNIDLVSLEDKTLIPIPFDFDGSGIINTPYAIPSPELPIDRVEDRFYKGPCKTDSLIIDFEEVITLFNIKKSEILAMYEGANFLDNRYKRNAIRYIENFYEIINDSDKFEMELEKSCKHFNTIPTSAPTKKRRIY